MGFKMQRGLKMPYRKQGRIYFTLVNYDDLPKNRQDKIDRLIAMPHTSARCGKGCCTTTATCSA